MLRTISLTVLLMAVLGVFAVEPAVAGKKKPKDKPVTCGSPTIITAGNYFLSGDCTGPGITINASNVTLNLKGHTMDGLSGTGSNGIYVNGGSKVKILGPGTITGYEFGVSFDTVSHSAVEKLSVTNNSGGVAFFGVSDSKVQKVNASNNSFVGIVLLNCTDTEIENNVTNGNGDLEGEGDGDGLLLLGSSNIKIEDCRANDNTSIGISIDEFSTNIKIEDCRANDNTLGISIDEFSTNIKIEDCRFNDNTSIGISIDGTGNEIKENTAVGNGTYDLEDTNPDCDDNEWEDNDFDTASSSCID